MAKEPGPKGVLLAEASALSQMDRFASVNLQGPKDSGFVGILTEDGEGGHAKTDIPVPLAIWR